MVLMAAHATNSPVSLVMAMTMGQVCAYLKRMDQIMPFLNPLAALTGSKDKKKSEEHITDPAAISAFLSQLKKS